jgi:hypothetical protein
VGDDARRDLEFMREERKGGEAVRALRTGRTGPRLLQSRAAVQWTTPDA